MHGRLTPGSVILTSVGVVKILGFGDPHWLNGSERDATVSGDLTALGELAADWAARAARRRGAKSNRLLPAPLQAVLTGLQPTTVNAFTSAAEVLAALDRASASLPDAADAWDLLLENAAENGKEPAAFRKSA
jgi:hypothetical protein